MARPSRSGAWSSRPTTWRRCARGRSSAGRSPSPTAGSSDLAVVVCERFWKDRLNGGESIAGRTLSLNGSLFSIVGVLPEGFQGPGGLYEPDLWLPLEKLPLLKLSPTLTDRQTPWLTVAGRMKAGVTAAQAQADLRGIMEQLAQAHPSTNTGRSVSFLPVMNGVPELRRIAQFAWIGLAVVGIVLLIACFNVAGLLLARAAERQREIGGAHRARRDAGPDPQAIAGRRRPARSDQRRGRADPRGVERRPAVGIQPAFADPATPALRARRAHRRLHAGAGRARRRSPRTDPRAAGQPLRRAPGDGEPAGDRRPPIADPQPVRARPGCRFDVVSRRRTALRAQLLERGVVRSGLRRRSHAGARAEPASFGYDAERAQGLFGSLVERLRVVPGIEPSRWPIGRRCRSAFPRPSTSPGISTSVRGPRCRSAIEFGISADHFAALGLPLRAGRELTEQEVRANAPVVVVGEGMAQTLWPERIR